MRILVFGSYAPSLVNFRGPLLCAMLAAGHTVIAAAPDLDAQTMRALHDMGVETASVPLSRKGMNPLRDLAALAALVRRIRESAPDVMFSYTIKPVIYGSLAARLAGVPHIYAMVEGLGYAFNGTGFRRSVLAVIAGTLYAIGMSVCRSVFFLNEDNREFFRRHHVISRSRRTCLVNGTGIDLDHYAATPLPADHAARPVFLCIARLLREKGVADFAAAARIVKQECPEAVFRMVGPFDPGVDSVSEGEVRQWREWMEVPGPVSDVRPDIAGCSVYVLPSYHEGVPRTTMEAMSMQRAVITTDAVGCRETVREAGTRDADGVACARNGLQVAVGDVTALARAMLRLARDPEAVARMGAESRRYAEDRFDVHKVNAVMLGEMELL